MRSNDEVQVTLSDNLIDHLCRLSYETDVPIRWLVAGMVCDTIDTLGGDGAKRLLRRASRPHELGLRGSRAVSRTRW